MQDHQLCRRRWGFGVEPHLQQHLSVLVQLAQGLQTASQPVYLGRAEIGSRPSHIDHGKKGLKGALFGDL